MSRSAKNQNLFSDIGFLVAIGTLIAITASMVFILPFSSGYYEKVVPLYWWIREAVVGSRGEWSHCAIVPLIILLLLYVKRKELATCELAPFYPGLALLVAGLGVFYFGKAADIVPIGMFGFQFTLMGAVLTIFGRQIFKETFFLLLALGFTWPLPFLETSLAFKLRMIMSEAAGIVLNTLGLATVKVGTAIVSAPDPALGLAAGQKFGVDVADPCSGIHSLFALSMIAAFYAYLAVKPTWKQFVVFVCAIPLAILGNLARIMMLTLGSIAFGTEFAIGKDAITDPSWFHMAAGYLIFIVAFAGLMIVSKLIMLDWGSPFGRLWNRGGGPPAKSGSSSAEKKTTSTHSEEDVF